ncbi:GDNF-inducible zinc finger protein 1-like isoform X3 [Penaeus chinensis]|uniref:GDNF-inducible zinc finger protein 1-like isoform X3 n=1 Tax=Penaeus chinensis TaxID=139456 RepID=UPI001FB6D7E4|nr:GDNF-inducible zinc finger protein 1-like isoform X3 [Penaeus chinensis]
MIFDSLCTHLPRNMAEEGCVEIGEANTGCKMEDSTTSLGGAPVVCLVCDCVIKELHRQDVPNVFLESSVTSHSQQQLANMLSVIIKSPLESSQVYSKTLCRRCFRLLDELDGIEQRSVVLKTTIEELYSRSLLRRMKGPRVSDEETIGAMDLGLPEDDEEDDGSKISVKVEPLDDDDDFLADELRPEDQGIRPDDPEFNPAHDNMWRSKSRSKGRGRGRGRSRGRARGRGRGRGPGRPPKNIKDEDAAANKAGESLGEKLGQLVNKILGDDESEEPVDMETETPTTSAEGVEEEVDATEKVSRKHPPTSQEDGIPCAYCPFLAPTLQTLHAHKTATHRDMDCPYCGRLLATWWAYERHLTKFHPNEVPEHVKQERASIEAALKSPVVPEPKKRGRKRKIQQCETCHEVFKSRPSLTYHIATKHQSKEHTCVKCNAVFRHPMLLASHILRHGERTVMCHRCGRKFFTQKQLNSHENLFHRRTRSYSCETCGGRFSTLKILRHHIRTQPHHKYYCQECGVSYPQKQQYLSHILTHGLRCTICNQSFATAVAAHQHYRSTHSGNTQVTVTSPGDSKTNLKVNAASPKTVQPLSKVQSSLIIRSDAKNTNNEEGKRMQQDFPSNEFQIPDGHDTEEALPSRIILMDKSGVNKVKTERVSDMEQAHNVVIILSADKDAHVLKREVKKELCEPAEYIINEDEIL